MVLGARLHSTTSTRDEKHVSVTPRGIPRDPIIGIAHLSSTTLPLRQQKYIIGGEVTVGRVRKRRWNAPIRREIRNAKVPFKYQCLITGVALIRIF